MSSLLKTDSAREGYKPPGSLLQFLTMKPTKLPVSTGRPPKPSESGRLTKAELERHQSLLRTQTSGTTKRRRTNVIETHLDTARTKELLAELKQTLPPKNHNAPLPPKHPKGISHLLKPYKVKADISNTEENKSLNSRKDDTLLGSSMAREGGPQHAPSATCTLPTQASDNSAVEALHSSNIDQYTVGRKLGQGAYATVTYATHKLSNRKVAMKTYEKSKLVDASRKRSVAQEIKLLQKLRHPHIVKLYETIETPRQMHLILEFLGGGSLNYYMRRCPRQHFSEGEAKRLFSQVLSAVEYCHSLSITHRDIKLENILIDDRRNIKLIDFGFATCLPNDKKIRLFCGTPSYMAPEIVARKEYCGPPADIWALGVLLHVMLSGTYPFKGKNDKELFKKILVGQFECPSAIPAAPRALIYKMLSIDPSRRPTVKEIQQDQWAADLVNIRFGSMSRSNSTIASRRLYETILNETTDSRQDICTPTVKSRVVKMYRPLNGDSAEPYRPITVASYK